MGIIYKNGIAYGNQPCTDAVAMIEPSEEASATSAHAYAVGEHFIYNDTLYRATAAIAIGDTITPDTNCVATTVMTEVEAGGGGGGGTSDYTQLSNKPQINGVTLTGNKTGADLGLVNAVTGKQLSTEDYTTAEKTKLAGIEAQANKTVIDDTLTNTGEAADAKAVGDEISDVRNTLNNVENGLAIIVNGDTCSTAVPVGGYAYIKDNTHGLTEGLYINSSSSAFPTSGGTANSTVFTAVSSGGFNDLKNYISHCEMKDLLWTGDGDRGEDTLINNIDLSSYSAVEIWVRPNGRSSAKCPFRLEKNVKKTLYVMRGEFIGFRNYTTTNNSVSCETGYYYPSYGNYQNKTAATYVALPTEIYGIY
jgi:hypothetical protein